MAQYKDPRYLARTDHSAFDALHHPGQITPDSGVYRCEVCGWEVVSEKGKPFPPQDHHTHPQNPYSPILWRLIVFAVHRT